MTSTEATFLIHNVTKGVVPPSAIKGWLIEALRTLDEVEGLLGDVYVAGNHLEDESPKFVTVPIDKVTWGKIKEAFREWEDE